MPGYIPLFGEIVTSSIWNEDAYTCKIWVTLMALSDKDGNIYASIAGLGPVARVTLTQAKKAIAILSEPDPYSRSKEYEGRRIVPIEGGWHIVNHDKYREKAQELGRKAYMRDYMSKYRKQNVNKRKQPLAYSDAYSDADSNSNKHKRAHKRKRVTQRACDLVTQEFDDEFWPNVPVKIGKGKARQAYIKARDAVSKEVILAGLPGFQAYEDGRKKQSDYRPLHPATWLNQERWTDELSAKETLDEQIARIERTRK
jgi:hypothetical protein